MKDVCILFHRDADGVLSALITYLYLISGRFLGESFNVYAYDVNYGEDPEKLHLRKEYAEIYMVDFMDIPFVEYALKRTDKLVIFDHHKTKADITEEYAKNPKIEMHFDPNPKQAACKLIFETYAHVFQSRLKPETFANLYKWVYYVNIWDTWQRDNAVEFNKAISYKQALELLMTATPLRDLLDMLEYTDDRILQMARGCLDHSIAMHKELFQIMKLEFKGKEYTVAVCNTPHRSSLFYEQLKEAGHIKEDADLIMMWNRMNSEKVTASMYSLKPDIDVGEIAKHYGGGGHKGAAGFVVPEIKYEGDKLIIGG